MNQIKYILGLKSENLISVRDLINAELESRDKKEPIIDHCKDPRAESIDRIKMNKERAKHEQGK
jgi:hypothetical protein